MIDKSAGLGMSGPAAIAAALNNLEDNVMRILRVAISKHELRGDVARTISTMHDSLARVLDDISRTYGTDAMNTASEYTVAALDAGLIYPGIEAEEFVRNVARDVRATSRDLIKSSGGSTSID